jgi:hypothetical protein
VLGSGSAVAADQVWKYSCAGKRRGEKMREQGLAVFTWQKLAKICHAYCAGYFCKQLF